jgi:hypothetical protein
MDKITTVIWRTTVRLGILKSLNNWVHSTTSSTVSAVPHWAAPSTLCFGSIHCFNIRPMLPKLHTAIKKTTTAAFSFSSTHKDKNISVFRTYKTGHWYCLESLYWLALIITLTESTGKRRIKHIKTNNGLNAVIPTVQILHSLASKTNSAWSWKISKQLGRLNTGYELDCPIWLACQLAQ